MSSHFTSLVVGSALSVAAAAQPAPDPELLDPSQAMSEGDEGTLWYDIRLLGVEGKGWEDSESPYDRLPAKAKAKVRAPVWGLARNSAGMCVRFVTDATAIKARWTLISRNLSMPHMPATGVSGLDLYVRSVDGKWRWLGVGRPTEFPTNTVQLAGGIPAGTRQYMLYLPLYNGVSKVELGIAPSFSLARATPRPPRKRKAVLFYGTSITQGGCASRPGMVHTAILGRRLDLPVLNLGFSGNGVMEPELATLQAELDPALYVLDCLPNMTAQQVAERVVPFVRILRNARADTPIVLVEDRSYCSAHLLPGTRKRNLDSRAELRKAYEQLTEEGVTGLSYLSGEKLLGEDSEGTVDGSHPTDLGFMRQADAFQPVLEAALRAAQRE